MSRCDRRHALEIRSNRGIYDDHSPLRCLQGIFRPLGGGVWQEEGQEDRRKAKIYFKENNVKKSDPKEGGRYFEESDVSNIQKGRVPKKTKEEHQADEVTGSREMPRCECRHGTELASLRRRLKKPRDRSKFWYAPHPVRSTSDLLRCCHDCDLP